VRVFDGGDGWMDGWMVDAETDWAGVVRNGGFLDLAHVARWEWQKSIASVAEHMAEVFNYFEVGVIAA
jgi:acyl-CoA thioesterase FadM